MGNTTRDHRIRNTFGDKICEGCDQQGREEDAFAIHGKYGRCRGQSSGPKGGEYIGSAYAAQGKAIREIHRSEPLGYRPHLPPGLKENGWI